MSRKELIKALFEEMRNDIYCMMEYNDSEPDLLNELNNCSDEILEEYAEIYLQ